MRDDLKAALQARWLDSLRARAAIAPHSPVPLLDELLAPIRAQVRPANQSASEADDTVRDPQGPTQRGDREQMISQIPPRTAADPTPGTGMGSNQRASELAKDLRASGWANDRTSRSAVMECSRGWSRLRRVISRRSGCRVLFGEFDGDGFELGDELAQPAVGGEVGA